MLPPETVRAVRAFEGGIRAAARAMGLSRARVARIRNGQAYAWVPDEPHQEDERCTSRNTEST